MSGRPVFKIGDVIENGYGHWVIIDQLDRRTPDRRIQFHFKHLETGEIKTTSVRALKKSRPTPKRKETLCKDHPLYRTYNAMKSRCYDKNHDGYRWYGALGIKICDRWLKSFWNFVEDMGDRPEGLTLDRIDGSKDYEPGNCKWSTAKEQAMNRKPNSGWIKKRGKTNT